MDLRQASRQRQVLRAIIEEHQRLALTLLHPRELIKGTLYQLRTRCGKETCRCARTKKDRHVSTVLSWSEEGRTRLRSVATSDEHRLRQLAEQYRRFRETRASLVQLHRQILEAINCLEAALRVPHPAPRRRSSEKKRM